MNKFFWTSMLMFCSLFLVTTACEEDAPLKLTAAQRDQLDTLFTAQIRTLNQELDSLCDQRFEEELDAVVDSIFRLRKAQEKALRQKYKQKL